MTRGGSAFLEEACRLAREGMRGGLGGPFGAVVVKGGKVVGRGGNRVLSTNDPTAHAEIVAIRAAAETVGGFDLSGCTLYATCEPCPMCRGAIQWARIAEVVYALTREDAARMGFDDAEFHAGAIVPSRRIALPAAEDLVREWLARADRRLY